MMSGTSTLPANGTPSSRGKSIEDGGKDIFVSVVTPFYNLRSSITEFVDEVLSVLQREYEYFELVLVDDGSDDGTAEVVSQVLAERPSIRLVRLSKHFGEELAIYAGLDSVIGDIVITMIPGYDPPELIPRFVDRVFEHGGIVIGVRRRRSDPLPARFGAHLFYWICNSFLGLDVPKNSTHFRALSRSALNALLQIKEKHRYLKVFSTYIGYQHHVIEYEPFETGRRRRGFFRSVDLAVNVMVAHSTRLLRLVTGLGILASGLNLLYMGYIFAIAVFKEDVAEGWITLSAQNAGMFFFLFLILTVLGEYVGRILAETQDRPLYYIMEEQNSSVLVSQPEQKNVVRRSVIDE